MMDDFFFKSDEEFEVMQVDVSDLFEEVMDYGVFEFFEEEVIIVFSDDQVCGFMDEGVLDDDLDEIFEDEDYIVIFDFYVHNAPNNSYQQVEQGYFVQVCLLGIMQFLFVDVNVIRVAVFVYNSS